MFNVRELFVIFDMLLLLAVLPELLLELLSPLNFLVEENRANMPRFGLELALSELCVIDPIFFDLGGMIIYICYLGISCALLILYIV